MGFLGVYRAVFDYAPQAGNELAISEGDLVFVLEKGADGWWKAKKKAPSEDEDEPEGLLPGNYVEEAAILSTAKALFDYDRQTDEELSFKEEAILNVYDTTDEDWTLVGLNDEYGFVPANYIEVTEAAPQLPSRPRGVSASSGVVSSSHATSVQQQSPAAALAGIIQQKTGPSSPNGSKTVASPSYPSRNQQLTPDESEEDTPPLPQRPQSQQFSTPSQPAPYSPPPEPRTTRPSAPAASPTQARANNDDDDRFMSSGPGFHIYNIHEMVSHLGRNRKMPSVLGINVSKGVIMIAPERSRDGPSKEWTAEKLEHYSLEGKHVFMELVKPSKSIDFHAGSKDTAQEIVAALGELAGASRAAGLREVAAASNPLSNAQKHGKILYDFMAQADDEVSVAIGDEVIILDDARSEEWWQVRRLKNGKEGSVPSSYVEIIASASLPTTSSTNGGRSIVEQNRYDEEQRTREAVHTSSASKSLPNRQSSLSRSEADTKRSSHKSKKSDSKSSSKTKPDASKIRTWTDRSGSFKVEAEFLGLKDGKIHLHKLNGVKIAVPISKMSSADIDFVEAATGQSLDEDKPLSDIKRQSMIRNKETGGQPAPVATVGNGSTYDWFDFFLACGVNPQICDRYASAFTRDQMGEENLPDIEPSLLRTLGLKEGDILRVMKHLDSKYGRVRTQSIAGQESSDIGSGANGGLFSGPGGALKNNTRKGRPAPAIQTNDTVDGKAFEPLNSSSSEAVAEARATPLTSVPARPQGASTSGFDDDAWDVKPSKQSEPKPSAIAPPVGPPPPKGALAELSLLDTPLQPTPAAQNTQQQLAQLQQPQQQQQQQHQQSQPAASPAFFNQLTSAPTGVSQAQAQNTTQRQRPQPPQITSSNSLMPPPPARPLSAPQNFQQQSAFGPPPLQPQLTGYRPAQQSQIAPPGQSMNELNQHRMQQSYGGQPQQLQYQQTGFGQQQYAQGLNGLAGQPTGYNQFALQSQPTGFQNFPPQIQQQFINGQQQGSPFADPNRPQMQPQQTGFQPQMFSPPIQPQQTGINNFLPPALQPQRTGFSGNPSPFGNQSVGNFQSQPTGMQSQPTGMTMSISSGFGQQIPPMPPIPSQQHQQQQQQQAPMAQPLVPQKTGPAPPVKFGVQPAAPKLVPQPTGRANLMNATPQNPFGF